MVNLDVLGRNVALTCQSQVQQWHGALIVIPVERHWRLELHVLGLVEQH